MQGKKRRFRTPSPATALSVVALFVSLGGVSYAAATIGSSQIKNNSVASKDIKNKTISTKDISSKARKALKGAKGPAGAAGKVGPAGPAGRSALSSLVPASASTGPTASRGWGRISGRASRSRYRPRRRSTASTWSSPTTTPSPATAAPARPTTPSPPGVRVPLYEHLRGHHQRIRVWCALQLWELRRDGRREPLRLHGSGKQSRRTPILTANGVWVYTAP